MAIWLNEKRMITVHRTAWTCLAVGRGCTERVGTPHNGLDEPESSISNWWHVYYRAKSRSSDLFYRPLKCAWRKLEGWAYFLSLAHLPIYITIMSHRDLLLFTVVSFLVALMPTIYTSDEHCGEETNQLTTGGLNTWLNTLPFPSLSLSKC